MGQQDINTTYEKQISTLAGVLHTIREEENVDVLVETALNYLKAEFQYRLIWISLYDRLEHQLVGKGGITTTGDSKFLKQKFVLSPGDILEQVVIQQRPVGIPDLQQEVRAGEWRRAAKEFGIQGALLFPLLCKTQCFGVAMLGSHLWGTTPRSSEKAQMSLLFGGLATTLYQLEMNWQHTSAKHADQPLFQMLEQLQNLPTLAQRLDIVVNMTQEFVTPSRTNLYWYSPERRYFWQRVGNKQGARKLRDSDSSAPGLSVQEVSEFYLALAAGQTVAIGSGKSPLKAEVTGFLLSRLRSRSILATPILVKGELVGFLAAEGNEARIWEQVEQNYVRAAAQVVGLVTGSEDMEATLQQTQQDANFIAEIASAFDSNADLKTTLKQCADLLLKRLGVERFLVLQQHKDENVSAVSLSDKSIQTSYTIVYQQQPLKASPLTTLLEPLNSNDQKLLEESSEVVVIEDWEKDLRFSAWRESLMPLGVRSLLVCRTSKAKTFGLLIVAHGTPRSWNQAERRVVGIVSQQMGQLLHTLEIQTLADQLSSANQTLQAGLTALLAAPSDPTQFERAWIQYLSQVLDCPLVALLSWRSHKQQAQVAAAVVTDPSFALPSPLSIPIAADTLIKQAIATNGFLHRSVTNLPPGTRKWLNSPNIGQVLVVALHTTPGVAPTGIVLLADRSERQWSRHILQSIETLIRQFASFRQYRRLGAGMSGEVKALEELNWYKHRCLETLHHAVTISVNRFLEMDSQDQGQLTDDQPLRRTRSSQIVHQMENALAPLSPLLNEEQWHMKTHLTSLPLANLLQRSLRRVESLCNQRQILTMVHHTGNLNVYGDLLKLECVLFELLITFCYRAQPESRIDLWCRTLDQEVKRKSEEGKGEIVLSPFLELLITDSDLTDSSSEETKTDFSTATPLKQPPSLQMKICQRVLRPWGGDLLFYQLENGRFMSRLLLPLAK